MATNLNESCQNWHSLSLSIQFPTLGWPIASWAAPSTTSGRAWAPSTTTTGATRAPTPSAPPSPPTAAPSSRPAGKGGSRCARQSARVGYLFLRLWGHLKTVSSQETAVGATGGRTPAPTPAGTAPRSSPGHAPTLQPWGLGCHARGPPGGRRLASPSARVRIKYSVVTLNLILVMKLNHFSGWQLVSMDSRSLFLQLRQWRGQDEENLRQSRAPVRRAGLPGGVRCSGRVLWCKVSRYEKICSLKNSSVIQRTFFYNVLSLPFKLPSCSAKRGIS